MTTEPYKTGKWLDIITDNPVDVLMEEICPYGGKVAYQHNGRDWYVIVTDATGHRVADATNFWFVDALRDIKRQQEKL